LLTALAAAGLVAGTLLTATAVFAVHDEGVFQLDGNALTAAGSENPGSNLTGAHDWSQIFTDRAYVGDPPFPTSGANSQTFVTDFFGAGDSILTGGQTKDIYDLPNNWIWKQTTTTSVQDKDDIEHAFAAQYTVDKSGGQCGSAGPQANCVLLYFGADRFANSGDTTMGFWFYKSKVGISALDAGGNGTFTGQHVARSGTCPGATCVHGDVLILSDFLIGGAAPTVSILEWVNSGGSASTHLDLIGGGTATTASCTQASGAHKGDPVVPPVQNDDNYCATTNQNLVTSPWPFTAKANSGGISGAGGTAKFGISEFMEGGINMTALGLGNECFASFLAETRASHSPTSTLSDFALGTFGSCGASLATQTSKTTLEIGAAAPTDAATITVKSSGANPPAPTGIVSFYLCGPSTTAITSCTPSGTAFDTKNLTGAAVVGKTYTVTSAPPTITTAGNYCFAARWPGDTSYTDGPYGDNGTNECFTVTPKTPSIVTTSEHNTGTVVPGTAVADDALLSGTATPSNGTQGTITFMAYGPNDATCATAVYTSIVDPIAGDGTYNSFADGDGGAFAPTGPGTYRWRAFYAPATGDVNNVATNEACNGTGEAFVVEQFQPALTTAQTWTVKDSATVTVTGGGNLAGSVHFQLFPNSTCTGTTTLVDETVAVSGATPQTVSTTPKTITTTSTTLYWKVSYGSTNGAQKDIAATCTENSSVTINN
jgi:hypothetical protein